jgi:hypothetical protein
MLEKSFLEDFAQPFTIIFVNKKRWWFLHVGCLPLERCLCRLFKRAKNVLKEATNFDGCS